MGGVCRVSQVLVLPLASLVGRRSCRPLRASMRMVEIVGVDPSDTQFMGHEPVYRVYLWGRPDPPPGVTPEQMGWWCDEYRVLGAPSVRAVLDWAEEHAGPVGPNSTYTLYVETQDGGRPGLILLAGTDPTERPWVSGAAGGVFGPDEDA